MATKSTTKSKSSGTAKNTKKTATKKSSPKIGVQRLKNDFLVKILGQTANTLSFTANILPIEVISPTSKRGYEKAKIEDGSVFDGVYLITEMVTVYGAGVRSRTVSGIGYNLDSGETKKLVDVPKKSSKNTLPTKQKSTTTGKKKPSNTKTKDKKKDDKKSTPKGGKPTNADGKYYYNPDTGKWYPV